MIRRICALALLPLLQLTTPAIPSMAAATEPKQNNAVLLSIKDVPAHGLALTEVDLTEATALCGIKSVTPDAVRAFTSDGKPVPFMFVPDPDFNPVTKVTGTIVCRLSSTEPTTIRLRCDDKSPSAVNVAAWDGTVKTGSYEITHALNGCGGLPAQISFPKTGKILKQINWHDRLHSKKLGGFLLSADPKATARLIARNEIATVVRTTAAYSKGNNTAAPGRPTAVYDWFYFHDLPLVHVRATISQDNPQPSNATPNRS